MKATEVVEFSVSLLIFGVIYLGVGGMLRMIGLGGITVAILAAIAGLIVTLIFIFRDINK